MNSIIKVLAKIADDLDAQKKDDVADRVDQALQSIASRPKSPLKSLDDEVKKSLLQFLCNIAHRSEKTSDDLSELFRRLRYFDIDGMIKELGLDKLSGDVKKCKECSDSAQKKFYEFSFGKKPTADDIKNLLTDEEDLAEDKAGPLSFFESQEDDAEDSGDAQDISEEDLEDFIFWERLESCIFIITLTPILH